MNTSAHRQAGKHGCAPCRPVLGRPRDEHFTNCCYHTSPAAQNQPARQVAGSPTDRRKGRSNAAAAPQQRNTQPPSVSSTSGSTSSSAPEAETAGGNEATAGSRAQVMRANTGGRYQLPPMAEQRLIKQAPISTNLLAEPYK